MTDLRFMRFAALGACMAVAACGNEEPASGPRLRVDVAALSLNDVGDALYTLRVRNGAGELERLDVRVFDAATGHADL